MIFDKESNLKIKIDKKTTLFSTTTKNKNQKPNHKKKQTLKTFHLSDEHSAKLKVWPRSKK